MKMLTVSFFICVMMALTPSADARTILPITMPLPEIPLSFSCPDGWTKFIFHCLHYVPTKMTWAEAEKNCRGLATHRTANLASVYDSAGAHEIHGMLKHAGHEHGKVWVGGHNTAENPSWSWTDGLGVHQFHDLCSKEHKHHCAQLTFEEKEAGCLADMDCETKLPSVCAMILM